MREDSRQEKMAAPLTAASVRAVARALEGILFEIQGGAAFQITRLTRVKRLCTDQATAEAFAAFIADRAYAKLLERKQPKTVSPERWGQFMALAREGVIGLERHLADHSAETERALREQHHALFNAQREQQPIPYGAARVIVCWEAMQVETALACVLAHEPKLRSRYGYELASDYVKRDAPNAFGDLHRASVEPLAEVTRFWHDYADHLAAVGKVKHRKDSL